MKVYPCISIDLKLFTYFHMCKKECALTWKHHHSLNIYACFYAVIHECAKVLREEDDMKTEKYELNKVEKYELDWERRGEDDKSKEERWVEETKRTRQEMSHTGFCLCQTMCEQCVCVCERDRQEGKGWQAYDVIRWHLVDRGHATDGAVGWEWMCMCPYPWRSSLVCVCWAWGHLWFQKWCDTNWSKRLQGSSYTVVMWRSRSKFAVALAFQLCKLFSFF